MSSAITAIPREVPYDFDLRYSPDPVIAAQAWDAWERDNPLAGSREAGE